MACDEGEYQPNRSKNEEIARVLNTSMRKIDRVKKRFVIDGLDVARMEMVLDVYKREFDPLNPVVCMDESPKQLIAEMRIPLPASPGKPARHDYEYKRRGVCNIFMACEPLAGKRIVKITETKTKQDWAFFLKDIANNYQETEKITLVMDNLNTHTPGSFYETFPPEQAKALWDRFEFVYTPKHGSWLNMAEIELKAGRNLLIIWKHIFGTGRLKNTGLKIQMKRQVLI